MTDSIIYRNHLIKIENDHDPVNPLTDWDHGCDVIVYFDRSHTEYGDGPTLTRAPEFTREEIKKSWKDICDAVMEDRPINLLAVLEQEAPHYFSNYHNAVDLFNETIYHVFENMRDSEKVEAIATLYNLKDGFVAYSGQGHGYSQSDWHYIAVVKSTDEYLVNGELSDEAKQNALNYCKGTATTYKCWAYGDVYGFRVFGEMCPDARADGEDEEDEDYREELHSVWGFYGEYGSEEYKYVIQEAKNEIDHSIKQLELDLDGEAA